MGMGSELGKAGVKNTKQVMSLKCFSFYQNGSSFSYPENLFQLFLVMWKLFYSCVFIHVTLCTVRKGMLPFLPWHTPIDIRVGRKKASSMNPSQIPLPLLLPLPLVLLVLGSR